MERLSECNRVQQSVMECEKQKKPLVVMDSGAIY